MSYDLERWLTYHFLTLSDKKKFEIISIILAVDPSIADSFPRGLYSYALEHMLASNYAKDYLERYLKAEGKEYKEQ